MIMQYPPAHARTNGMVNYVWVLGMDYFCEYKSYFVKMLAGIYSGLFPAKRPHTVTFLTESECGAKVRAKACHSYAQRATKVKETEAGEKILF